MSEVKRFDAFTSFDDFKSRMVESKDGNYVAYSDYISQLQQTDALQTSLNNIINAFGISGEGAHSKLVIEYVSGLVAENAAIKASVPALKEVSYENDSFDDVSIAEEIGFNEAVSMMIKSIPPTPNTDAFTAELRAQGVYEYAQAFSENTNMDFACNRGFYHGALDFAANLRAGRNG
ncbi:hypothetical protein A8A01_09240 [Ewingella americana]|uniref:hypothetical protein n=1 Tax=Rahnella victoriana TaxID=1510570 RepID=UPI000BB18B89|nr:hypothetical protein [Rahnella victoriana]PBI79653.1 hypothetical protein A9993_07825 [Rahnella victoriana]PKB90084.1 hypothetical protein A8A01_09240 [Ewingella americana]